MRCTVRRMLSVPHRRRRWWWGWSLEYVDATSEAAKDKVRDVDNAKPVKKNLSMDRRDLILVVGVECYCHYHRGDCEDFPHPLLCPSPILPPIML